MRRLLSVGLGLLALLFVAQAQSQEQIARTNLKMGDTAPDFILLDNNWKPVRLGDFRGKKNVVLAFYVLAFTDG